MNKPWRAMLMNAGLLLVIAAAVWTGFHFAGHEANRRDLLSALLPCLVAMELAAVPMILSGGADQGAVSQAGLVATLVHLLVALCGAAVVMFKLHPSSDYVYWLMGFYMLSLMLLVRQVAGAIKAAPPMIERKKEKN